MRKPFSFMMMCLLCVLSSGCAQLADKTIIRSEAFLTGDMGGWKIRHPNDLTVGGTADIAESKEIAFEIRVRRSEDDQWFVVKMKFIELIEPIEFRPSLITLQCSNGETLKGKPLSCYNEKWDIESLFQS